MALLDYTASARVIGRRSVLQFASALGVPAFVLGCGGDSTGPDAPNVAGRYLRTAVFEATTCSPQRPPPGGTVILDAFSQSVTVRVEQTGSRLTMTYPDFPAAPPDTGSVDRSGKVTFGFKVSFQEDPREGNRLFFVDLTASHELQRLDDGGVDVRDGAVGRPLVAASGERHELDVGVARRWLRARHQLDGDGPTDAGRLYGRHRWWLRRHLLLRAGTLTTS